MITLPQFRKSIRQSDGDSFVPVLMRVETRDEHGRPEKLLMVPGDRALDIDDGQEFLIVYVNERTLSTND